MPIRPLPFLRTIVGFAVIVGWYGAAPALARQNGVVLAEAGQGGAVPANGHRGATHTVSVGIRGIVVLAVDLGSEPIEPGVGRTGVFALTSNRDATNLVARLDEALPPGLTLVLRADTDLSSSGKAERLIGADEVLLLEGLSRGVRQGQALHLHVQGHSAHEVRRTLNVGLVDPGSGQASWQAIALTIRER